MCMLHSEFQAILFFFFLFVLFYLQDTIVNQYSSPIFLYIQNCTEGTFGEDSSKQVSHTKYFTFCIVSY